VQFWHLKKSAPNLVTVGDHRLYVRIDGIVFTKLHTDIPGI
jgi:hypothetical protein